MKFIFASLIFLSSTVYAQQKLYGVATTGGVLNGGAIFAFNADGSDFETKVNFGSYGQKPSRVIVLYLLLLKSPEGDNNSRIHQYDHDYDD